MGRLMAEEALMIKETYRIINLEGSHYEVGQKLGKRLREHKRLTPHFITGTFDPKGTAFESFKELQDFCESFCPGITEETAGFADILGVRPENVAFYHKYLAPRERRTCSQFAVLPRATEDGSVYVGRNYDMSPAEEDLCLLRTSVEGTHTHIGFSMQGLGRLDGMNAEGLAVTMTGGGAYEAPISNKRSFMLTLAVRALLDTCTSADEAVDMLMQMPVYWSTIYLFADKSGRAALVEGMDSKYAVRYAGEGTEEYFIFSTNHYTHLQMVSYNKYINEWLMPNSQARYKTLASMLQSGIPYITKDKITSLLSTEMPGGLCAPYYSEWFGTLWSMVFDLTHESADVCFGPPTHNPYHRFDMKKSFQDEDFTVLLPDKKS